MLTDIVLKIVNFIWSILTYLWPKEIPFFSLDGVFVPMLNWIHNTLQPVYHFVNVFFPLGTLFLCFIIFIGLHIIVFLWQASKFGVRLFVGNRVK
jgi:hypothetical protein